MSRGKGRPDRRLRWLILPTAAFTLVALVASLYIEHFAVTAREQWTGWTWLQTHLAGNAQDPIQWWQALLIELAATTLAITLGAVYVDYVTRRQRHDEWHRAQVAASQFPIGLLKDAIRAVAFSLDRQDLRPLVEDLDALAPDLQRIEIFDRRRTAISAVLTGAGPAALVARVVDDRDAGWSCLQDLAEWGKSFLARVDDWIAVFGHHLDPDTSAALVDLRSRLRETQSHAAGMPSDLSVGPALYDGWRRQGAAHWIAILTLLDELGAYYAVAQPEPWCRARRWVRHHAGELCAAGVAALVWAGIRPAAVVLGCGGLLATMAGVGLLLGHIEGEAYPGRRALLPSDSPSFPPGLTAIRVGFVLQFGALLAFLWP